MLRIAIAVCSLLLLGAGIWLVPKWVTQPIQDKLLVRVQAELDARGASEVQARLEGRDLQLKGNSRQLDRELVDALASVKGVRDIRLIVTETAAAPAVPEIPFSYTELLYEGNTLSLGGNHDPGNAISQRLQSLPLAGVVFHDLSLPNDSRPPVHWQPVLDSALQYIPHLSELRVMVTPQRIEARAYATEIAPIDALKRELDDLASRFTLDLDWVETQDTLALRAQQTLAGQRGAMSVEQRAQACQADMDALLSANRLEFKRGRVELDANAEQILISVRELLSECAGLPLEVQAFTDSRGAESLNLSLSEKRAQAVVEALVRVGIDSSLLSAKGFGEANPIASNDTAEGRARNRRIAIQVLLP